MTPTPFPELIGVQLIDGELYFCADDMDCDLEAIERWHRETAQPAQLRFRCDCQASFPQ